MQITKQKGGILMRKKKLVTMIAALALTISSATMGALPVNAAENDDVKVMDFVDKDVFSDGEEALTKWLTAYLGLSSLLSAVLVTI